MATVTKCDSCGNICTHEESKYIELFNVLKNDAKGPVIARMEICPNCYNKLKEVLAIDE